MRKLSLKRKLAVLSVAAIIAALSAYGSVAYFTAEDTARNVITTGSVKIELQEKMLTADGETTVPFEDRLEVMPGCEVSKIVTVKNTGGQAAWVRVSVDKAIVLAEGVEGDVDPAFVSFEPNTQYWTEKDGFYYYTAALAPGQTSEPLFTAVRFSAAMGNLYQDSKAVLTVNAYATQAANNGTTVFEAAGWPEAKEREAEYDGLF